jgi:hypothetical protein
MNYRKEKNAKDSSLLISGILIGLSFILLVFPLGIYHLAQISALMRRRTALYLMLTVSFLILLLALITSSVLLTVSAVISICCIPFFAFGLYERAKHAHWSRTLLVFFLPVFFILFYIFSLEKMTEFDLNKLFEHQKNTLQTSSQELKPQESLENKQHKIENFTAMSSFETLKAMPAYKTFLNILGMTSLERLSWFIYGPGSSFLLMLFIMVLSCLVFLDFGYDQVERFKAISKYIIMNKQLFPDYMMLNLYRIPELFFRNLKTPFEVVSHKPLPSRQELDEKDGDKKNWSFLKPLLRRKSSDMESFWQGFSFSLKGKSTWNLKNFSLSLLFVFTAIAFFIAMLIKFQNPDNIISSSEKGALAYLFVGGGLASFFVLTIVSMQGLITLYRRLSPGFLLVLVLCIWFFSAGISIGPYAVIALFSTIGLLDYIYDWRGIKKYSRKQG